MALVERVPLRGLADADLLRRMRGERRTILSENAADFVPLVARVLSEGGWHSGVLISSPRSLPRRADTVGLFVRSLDAFLAEHSGDEACRNALRWLPAASASSGM